MYIANKSLLTQTEKLYGGMYVPNFLLYIAHLRSRKLNYDVVNWILTS